jgi:lipopolysaccharide transport system ATP-binding protein
LLKLLSHITAPSVGHISYRGRIASLLEVGTGFHPEMTARQNIYMNGSIMGMTRHEITSKLDEIVDFAGIERYLDTPVKRFSSGMTVRLGFAVAAFLEPEILVVDEVLAVGDAEFQKKAIGKMKDVSSSGGRTVLFVSHNMAAVRNLCKSGIVLQNGGLIYNGTADDAIDYYMQTCHPISSSSIVDMPRSGKCTGKIKFVAMKYLDREGNEIIPHCGKYLKVKLTVYVKSPGYKGCRVSFGIYDMYENILTTFPTDVTKEEFCLSEGYHDLELEIEKLPLTVGSYRILLWSDVFLECSDFIDKAIKMDVEDDDFYGKGRHIPSHVLGKTVLCDHEWTIT